MNSRLVRPRQTPSHFGPFSSELELASWATGWAPNACPPGVWVELEGPLGVGKTFCVEAILRTLGLREDDFVGSPTYPLVHEYPEIPNHPVRHFDCYRLKAPAEAHERGLIDLAMDTDYSVFMEWPDRLSPTREAFYRLRPAVWRIELSLDSQGRRMIEVRDLLNRSDE